ncbi:MAG: hypothetical protein J3R72DRAFT_477901 [Linnemannia gamsii]|nr:MAG: hypothetical protein J3R72DRAFT_477901 [Linnemannia gamsii]
MSPTSFVCLESFRADNTTSCRRYPTTNQCQEAGNAKGLHYLCVVPTTTIVAGGPFPANLPYNVTKTVFLCSATSCPDGINLQSVQVKGDSSSGAMTDKKLSISGLFVLTLVVSQLVLL